MKTEAQIKALIKKLESTAEKQRLDVEDGEKWDSPQSIMAIRIQSYTVTMSEIATLKWVVK